MIVLIEVQMASIPASQAGLVILPSTLRRKGRIFVEKMGLNLLPVEEVAVLYRRAIDGEVALRQSSMEFEEGPVFSCAGLSAAYVYGVADYLFQVFRSSLTPRGYTIPYGLLYTHAGHIWQGGVETQIVFESVGAHTNAMSAMTDMALAHRYGFLFGDMSASLSTADGYTYREIMHAARLHDLPENVIGDILDNGSANEVSKAHAEKTYFDTMRSSLPPQLQGLQARAESLVAEMSKDFPSSDAARLLKVADKSSAILMCLLLDAVGQSPMLSMNTPRLSPRDRAEMELCDYAAGDLHRASEMWTADLFNIRRFIRCDDTGFFVALIIMATLMVHGTWYSWREKLYPPAIAG